MQEYVGASEYGKIKQSRWPTLARDGIQFNRSEERVRSIRETMGKRWMELATMLAREPYRQELSELVKEIDQLLTEEQDRLNALHLPSKPFG
jgi:hypothetical protein